MRRTVFAALMLIILLTGCATAEPLPGEELILAARQSYASLDSARVTVINAETGAVEQEFVFKYDEKDIMTYSYEAESDGVRLAQYNNGREQFTDDNGNITMLDVTDRDFTAYSRDIKYPMADEGLILFYKAGVIAEQSYIGTAALLDCPNGVEVHHEYDVSKIASQYSGEGQLTAFSADYLFESGGALVRFYENAEITNGDETVSYRYFIDISDINSVEKVENVVDISAGQN